MSFPIAKIHVAVALAVTVSLAACGGGSMSAVPSAQSSGGASSLAMQRALPGLQTYSPIDLVDKIVYNLAGYPDGQSSYSPLLNVNGTFYGTTYSGGANDGGSVFSVTAAGTEKIIHSFGSTSGPDGANPEGNVIDVGGTLYGTTFEGGADGFGCVYSVVIATGVEKVVYSFGGPNANDGSLPLGGLVSIGNFLYGTTSSGGAPGIGTVYKVTKTGVETILHSFTGDADGGSPEAGLLNVGGLLYGTTGYGGANGTGTVFSITTGGAKNVIYNFLNGGGDASYPYAALIDVAGTLYGTTEGGGTTAQGTVFSVTRPARRRCSIVSLVALQMVPSPSADCST